VRSAWIVKCDGSGSEFIVKVIEQGLSLEANSYSFYCSSWILRSHTDIFMETAVRYRKADGISHSGKKWMGQRLGSVRVVSSGVVWRYSHVSVHAWSVTHVFSKNFSEVVTVFESNREGNIINTQI
jgi:hypothetical protein